MTTVIGTEAHELVNQEVLYMFLNPLLLQHQHVKSLLLKSSQCHVTMNDGQYLGTFRISS